MSPRRAPPLLAALSLLTALAGACVDPVARARLDDTAPTTPPPHLALARVPGDLDLRPEAQLCEQDQDCALVQGLSGQRPETLCCASCAAGHVALNLDNAQRVAAWKGALECSQIACPPLGDCDQTTTPPRVSCAAGVCQRDP